MKALIKEAVNKVYTMLLRLEDPDQSPSGSRSYRLPTGSLNRKLARRE
jgi:hypothetical protein